MTQPISSTHLVMIPSYNSGSKLYETVISALSVWYPVWVIIDGSTDGSDKTLEPLLNEHPQLKVIRLATNLGKGGAVLEGIKQAKLAGFTHVLTMDADGQHPSNLIQSFMAKSQQNPEAMILGKPVFDENAPALRVSGRKISNWWANLETLWQGIGDSLYGFRIYPIEPLIKIMNNTRWMRRYDFDPEAVVRLCWAGVRPINIDAPVKYFTAEEGGVSHFNYLRDNTLLTGMHIRLMVGFALKLPKLLLKQAK